eukprot:1373338-Amorphochlora_amoeboformis.AAC.1
MKALWVITALSAATLASPGRSDAISELLGRGSTSGAPGLDLFPVDTDEGDEGLISREDVVSELLNATGSHGSYAPESSVSTERSRKETFSDLLKGLRNARRGDEVEAAREGRNSKAGKSWDRKKAGKGWDRKKAGKSWDRRKEEKTDKDEEDLDLFPGFASQRFTFGRERSLPAIKPSQPAASGSAKDNGRIDKRVPGRADSGDSARVERSGKIEKEMSFDERRIGLLEHHRGGEIEELLNFSRISCASSFSAGRAIEP